MRRPLRTELRRGVGIWAALPLAVAMVAIALAHPRDWAGDWSGWAYYLRTSLIVFGPLVVAAAAWQGGRERRRGMVELLDSTSRSPLQQASASLASPALWSLVAFTAVAGAMASVTASYATYGRPPALLALSAAAAVVMFAALGFVAGRLVPWRVTAPLLAVGAYLTLGIASYSQSRSAYLSPAVQLFPSEVPAPWWAFASIATYLALGVAALLLVGPRSRWFAAPVLGLALLAAQPISRAGQDAFTVDADAEQLVCVEGSPQVCLTQRHAGQLPEVARAVQQVLAGLDTPGPVTEQRFGDGLNRQTGTLNSLYLGADLRGHADLAVVRQDAAQLALSWNCGGEPYPPDDDLAVATIELTDWVRERPQPPYTGALQGRTAPEALTLVKQFAAVATTCDLTAARRLLATGP